MANTPIPTLDPSLTMSSREIAELCGKEHKNVMADIRKLADFYTQTYSAEKSAQSIKSNTYKDSTGRELPCFALDKQACLDLVTGYSLPHRHAVNKRWLELEEAARQPAPTLPASPHPADLAPALAQFLADKTHTTISDILAALFPAATDAEALRQTVGRAMRAFPEWAKRRAQTPDGKRPWIYQRRAGLPPRAQPAALPAPSTPIRSRLLLPLENGKVVASEPVPDDAHVCSLAQFRERAALNGFRLVSPRLWLEVCEVLGMVGDEHMPTLADYAATRMAGRAWYGGSQTG